MFILFLSYGETTGGGVPSDAVTAHQEGYGAKKPEGEEKEDVESPELAATELAEEADVAAKDAERKREACKGIRGFRLRTILQCSVPSSCSLTRTRLCRAI